MTLPRAVLRPARTDSAFLSGFRMFDIDDIITRDDAAELSDFMARGVCNCSMSDEGQHAIILFRNHTFEVTTTDRPVSIKIDGVALDTSARPAITNLLLSLMSALQPSAKTALAF